MNILLLGSGGREHALAWKLAQSRLCERLWVSPGNPGIAEVVAEINARHESEGETGEPGSCFDMDLTDHELVVGFCENNAIGLVVIGPEAPLVDGLADSLRGEGISVFGPSQAAAQLEGSKGFTKDLCERAGIPTAGYVRTSSLDQALRALGDFKPPTCSRQTDLPPARAW